MNRDLCLLEGHSSSLRLMQGSQNEGPYRTNVKHARPTTSSRITRLMVIKNMAQAPVHNYCIPRTEVSPTRGLSKNDNWA